MSGVSCIIWHGKSAVLWGQGVELFDEVIKNGGYVVTSEPDTCKFHNGIIDTSVHRRYK